MKGLYRVYGIGFEVQGLGCKLLKDALCTGLCTEVLWGLLRGVGSSSFERLLSRTIRKHSIWGLNVGHLELGKLASLGAIQLGGLQRCQACCFGAVLHKKYEEEDTTGHNVAG